MVVLQKIYFFNTYLKNDKKTICKEQAGEGEEAVIYQENTHMLHIFFIHSSGNGYLGCFHVSAFVNSAAKNIGVHISFQRFSLHIWPGVGLQDHMVTLFLIFKGISIFFSIIAVPIYVLNNSIEGFLLLHTLSSIYYLQTFG